MLDKIMTMAVGMKICGIPANKAKVRIYNKVKHIPVKSINLIVDVVYMED